MSDKTVDKVSLDSNEMNFNSTVTVLKNILVNGSYPKSNILTALYCVRKHNPIKPFKQNKCWFMTRGYCECGTEVIETDKFCHNCGKALDWSVSEKENEVEVKNEVKK